MAEPVSRPARPLLAAFLLAAGVLLAALAGFGGAVAVVAGLLAQIGRAHV